MSRKFQDPHNNSGASVGDYFIMGAAIAVVIASGTGNLITAFAAVFILATIKIVTEEVRFHSTPDFKSFITVLFGGVVGTFATWCCLATLS